jgi:hypothetical protein
VNVGPSLGDVTPYTSLITSKHNQKPKFMDMVANVAQPFADNVAVVQSLYQKFDIDVAVGDQLDKVGEWIGASRQISVPLTGVYFSLDDPLLGFDQGVWFNSFNPVSGVTFLDDEGYRTLLRARIANNRWSGSIEDAYAIWDTAFAGTGVGILIQDYGNMHMLMALTGAIPNAVTLALFRGGYLNIKPAGVKIDGYLTPSVDDAPYFGFDVDNAFIAGFDTGAWGISS